MQITYLGHAGLYIESNAGTILCDPWFNPCYFASWFPFPSNEAVEFRDIANPDYLYISHEHQDHLDGLFLREHVSKGAVVILPDYPVRSLERKLRELGFSSFLRTENSKPIDIEGLRIIVIALVTPTDGPEGDSGLIIDNGEHRIFNQNDSRPSDMDAVASFGPYDAHFLQHSGAIWYPSVYKFPDDVKKKLSERKRANQQARAFTFIRQVDASFVFPGSGPPCFLDEDLFHLNDVCQDSHNIFYDQTVFLEYMREHGDERGRLVAPGSVIRLEAAQCDIVHPMSQQSLDNIFTNKKTYLEAYRNRKQPIIASAKASWPRDGLDLLISLKEHMEPLLTNADFICSGINGRVLLDCSNDSIVLDFLNRSVYRWSGQKCKYRFRIDPGLLEACVLNAEEDWVNSLFLSCRFEAERDGPYNEYVYTFFKCLSAERLLYAERFYAERALADESFKVGKYLVQRRCPHLNADLKKFGRVNDEILTCAMHGWQFEIPTGRCLTSDQCTLRIEEIGDQEEFGE